MAGTRRLTSAEGIPAPHHVIETSPGRHQFLWRVAGFDKHQAEAVVRSLAAQHNADHAVWDCARILRVPGFRNVKHAPTVTHYVRDLVTAPPEHVYGPSDFPAPSVAEQIIAQGPRRVLPEGHRSQSELDYGYARRQLEKGRPVEEIVREIVEYRRAHKPKPSLERYARRTVFKARER